MIKGEEDSLNFIYGLSNRLQTRTQSAIREIQEKLKSYAALWFLPFLRISYKVCLQTAVLLLIWGTSFSITALFAQRISQSSLMFLGLTYFAAVFLAVNAVYGIRVLLWVRKKIITWWKVKAAPFSESEPISDEKWYKKDSLSKETRGRVNREIRWHFSLVGSLLSADGYLWL